MCNKILEGKKIILPLVSKGLCNKNAFPHIIYVCNVTKRIFMAFGKIAKNHSGVEFTLAYQTYKAQNNILDWVKEVK